MSFCKRIVFVDRRCFHLHNDVASGLLDVGIADKMKSVRLVQNFCPAKETNRTRSIELRGGFADTDRVEKMPKMSD